MTDNKEFQSISDLFSHTIASIVAKSYRAGKQAGQEQRDRLREALLAAQDHLEYCGYGDSWERDCAYSDGLPAMIEAALKEVHDD